MKTTTRPAKDTLANFDNLPDCASANLGVLKALTCASSATIYRRIEAGLLPKPKKLGSSHNLWNVGEIRAALRGVK